MLVDLQAVSANGTSAVLDRVTADALVAILEVTALPTGGAPTLDAYLQHSADNGATWSDIGHTQFTTSLAKRLLPVSGYAAGPTAPQASTDGTLSGETVVQGPFADQLRLKWKFAAGGSSGSYTFGGNIILKR